MNIKEYLENLKIQSTNIFEESINQNDLRNLGEVHHTSAFIHEFSESLYDENEKEILRTVSSQIEISLFNLTMGMYRQSFSSIRLAFEMGLSVVYFSVNKLEHIEWRKGYNDIKWAKLIDEDNGVLSKRYSKAFFDELSNDILTYNSYAKDVYREMSEYVHGNFDTWNKSGLELKYNETLKNEYFRVFKKMSRVLLFVLCCRYLKAINKNKLDELSTFLLEELNDIEKIRNYISKGE